MKNTLTIFQKETSAYFNTPMAYIIIVAFLLFTGWFFASSLFLVNQASIAQYLGVLPLFLTILVPAISMRLIAEELKMGTMEVLATHPLEDHEILLGKYLAGWLLLSLALGSTLFYPLVLSFLGNLDWGQVAGAYIGLILMGGSLLAVGLFASSLTKNQIIAFLLGFLFCFVFFMLGKVVNFVPVWLGTLVDYVGLDSHFENISKGVLDSRDLVYFLSLSGFFIFLSYLQLGSRGWK